MSYQYDLMGVIICWALTGLVVLIIAFMVVAIIYYLFSNDMKKEINKEVKEIVGVTKETVKEILK